MRDVCEKKHTVLMLEVISVKFSWDPDVFLLLLSLLPLNKKCQWGSRFSQHSKDGVT